MMRRLLAVVALAFSVAFLPQSAWAADPTPTETTTAEPTTAEPTTAAPTTAEPTTAATPTAEPTTAAPTTAAPTTEPPPVAPLVAADGVVSLDSGQFDVLVLASGLMVTLSAAGLVVGMRR